MADFTTVLKDMTAASVHVNAPLTTARTFKDALEEKPKLAKRDLQPNGHADTAKSPFIYDPNALGSLRPDQVPRFFGAMTDPEKLPLKEVKLADLHAMQDRVDPAKVEAIAGSDGGKPGVVVRHNGRDYIADGHHRLSADWLDGKDTARVRYKDLEAEDQSLKRRMDFSVAKCAGTEFAKAADELGLVFGWGMICKQDGVDYFDLNIDTAGQHAGKRVPENIPEPSMLKSALGFSLGDRAGNEMHDGPDRGIFPFVFPLTTELAKAYGIETRTTGLLVGYKPPPDVFAKFKSGEYSGFSAEGSRLSYAETI